MIKESQKRSILKALTWRVIAFVSLIGVILILGGSFASAFEIGLLDQAIKLIIHYGFERGWNHIKWGYIIESEEEME